MNLNREIYNYPEFKSCGQVFDPGELIQIDVENNVNQMIGIDAVAVQNIVIVGAWRGNEVSSFLKYPNATIYCFEPNLSNYKHFVDRWGSNNRVVCFNVACAAFDGEAILNETQLTGTDSLLPIKKDSETVLRLLNIHKVKTVALDSVLELQDKNIDLLWADVQGYELEVLRGADALLKRTKSLFLEVCRHNKDYEGGARYDDVIEFLDSKGFYSASQGLENNMGGNAFFLRKEIDNGNFSFAEYEERVVGAIAKISRKKYLINYKIVRFLLAHTPVRIKTFLKKIFIN
jgi:FkbM family methyltransferase